MKQSFKTMILGMAVVLFSISVYASTIKVAQDGTGDVKSVQAAIIAAKNGDEILITDNGPYVEDIMAGQGFQTAESFSIKAAEGKTPVIRAANQASRLASFGIVGIDYMGAAFLVCQNVLIEGIRFENTSLNANIGGFCASLTLADSVNVTLHDCTFSGAWSPGVTIPSTQYNSSVYVLGVGLLAPAGIVFDTCTLQNNRKGMVIQEWPKTSALGDPTVSIQNCIFTKCELYGLEVEGSSYPVTPDAKTTLQGPGITVEECSFSDSGTGIYQGGGYLTTNYNIYTSLDYGLYINYWAKGATSPVVCNVYKAMVTGCNKVGLMVSDNTSESDVNLNKVVVNVDATAFIGNAWHGVSVRRGEAHFTNSIFAGNAIVGAQVGDASATIEATFDHCDFYKNNKTGDVGFPGQYEAEVFPGNRNIKVSFTNTNFTGTRGILNGSYLAYDGFDPKACTVSYCNIFTTSDQVSNVTSNNLFSIDPKYVSPGTDIDPEAFDLNGWIMGATELLTKGKDGTYIGCMGAGDSGLENWDILQ